MERSLSTEFDRCEALFQKRLKSEDNALAVFHLAELIVGFGKNVCH